MLIAQQPTFPSATHNNSHHAPAVHFLQLSMRLAEVQQHYNSNPMQPVGS